MLTTELQKRASQLKPMPPDLTAPQQLEYLSLRHIYYAYRTQQIDKETAKQEKQRITKSCNEYSSKCATTAKLSEVFTQNIKASEMARTEYQKAKSAGASDSELLKLAVAALRGITGDTTL